MLDEIIEEKKFSQLTLKGKQYEGRFLAEQKINRIRLKGRLPAIWKYGYFWEGKGVIKDRKSGQEQEVFLDTSGNHTQQGLRENIIYFDAYFNEQRIIDYSVIIDLQLQEMYEKAKERLGKKVVIHPEPLKVKELIKKGLLREQNAKE